MRRSSFLQCKLTPLTLFRQSQFHDLIAAVASRIGVLLATAMRRREFIQGIVGSTIALPLAARAQLATKLPTVGFLGQSTRQAASEWVAAFVQRLRELGWVEGRTIAVEYRWAEGRADRAAEIAAEFAQRKVDVIVTSGTPQVVAAMQATSVSTGRSPGLAPLRMRST